MIAGDSQFICNKISGKCFRTRFAVAPGISVRVEKNLMRELAGVEISHGSGGLVLWGLCL